MFNISAYKVYPTLSSNPLYSVQSGAVSVKQKRHHSNVRSMMALGKVVAWFKIDHNRCRTKQRQPGKKGKRNKKEFTPGLRHMDGLVSAAKKNECAVRINNNRTIIQMWPKGIETTTVLGNLTINALAIFQTTCNNQQQPCAERSAVYILYIVCCAERSGCILCADAAAVAAVVYFNVCALLVCSIDNFIQFMTMLIEGCIYANRTRQPAEPSNMLQTYSAAWPEA